jgi:hypothetical protein
MISGMKMTSYKLNKRLTLLLAAVFSWLFVGSLIIFHQEHVLGKHTNAISHHYIVPKSKDKVTDALQQIPASQDLSLFTGDHAETAEKGDYFLPEIVGKLIISPSGLFSDHPPRMIFGLRAPPVA